MAIPHGQSQVSDNMRKQRPRAGGKASPSPCRESMTYAEGSRRSRLRSLQITMCRQRHSGSCERSEEHTSELQSLMRISYAVFCLKKKTSEPQLLMTIMYDILYTER